MSPKRDPLKMTDDEIDAEMKDLCDQILAILRGYPPAISMAALTTLLVQHWAAAVAANLYNPSMPDRASAEMLKIYRMKLKEALDEEAQPQKEEIH